jgi:glycosyltransferase involved in cell wall biosynthesis
LNVLLVCHGYPPEGVAGVERLTAQTAEQLLARGHQVTVLTRNPNETETLSIRREVRHGVPVVTIVGGGRNAERFPRLESDLEAAFERMLVEVLPDVVLVTHFMHHSSGYVELAHRFEIPVVVELHDFYMLCPRAHLLRRSGELCAGPEGGAACAGHCYHGEREASLRWALRSRSFADSLRAADAIVAPSQFVVDAFAPLCGPGRPIEVVENAVADLGPPLSPPPDPSAPLAIASIGVTVEHKGFHVVVEALRLAGLEASTYTILGILLPPLAEELQEAAAAVPGLDLRLVNGFSPPTLPALLGDSDLVVVPSLVAETYSIVAREAFACGLPVAASRIGALPAAIREGENGWLFESGDSTGLALLLQDLDADRGRIRAAAKSIRPDDHTGLATRADRIETILREVSLRGPRPPRPGAELKLMRDALALRDRGDAALAAAPS